MINPYVLQLLAMRQRGMNPYGSTAMDFPEDDIYGMQPWNPTPVEPFAGTPSGMAPGGDPVPVVGAPRPEMPVFDEAGARKRAQREGLGALGIALLAGAGKGDYAGSLAEGLAAMAAARRQRYEGERGQFQQDQQSQLARDAYERQDRLTQAQIANYEADNQRAQQEAEARSAGLQAEIAKQEAFVASLPPDLQQRLTPLIGTKELYPTYVEATKPKEPEKPNFFELSPGQTRYRYDESGRAVPIASRPPAPSSRMSDEDAATRAAAIAEAVAAVRDRQAPTRGQRYDDVEREIDRIVGPTITKRQQVFGDVSPEYVASLREAARPRAEATVDSVYTREPASSGQGSGAVGKAPKIPGDPQPHRTAEQRVQDIDKALGGLPPAVLEQVRRDVMFKLPRQIVAEIRAARGGK